MSKPLKPIPAFSIESEEPALFIATGECFAKIGESA